MGVKDQSITQPRVILITLSPLLNGGIFGASEPHSIRPYTDLPASFQYLGNQGDVFFRCARARVSVKETFGFEPVTCTTSNVKVLPTEL